MARPILIIEDDSDIADRVKYNFEREGFSAAVPLTGEQATVSDGERGNVSV